MSALRSPQVYRFDGTAQAHAYDEVLAPRLFAPWANDLVTAVAPRRGEAALDVACGTGVVTRALARALGDEGTVLAADASPDMIAVARTHLREGRMARHAYVRAVAESLPVASAQFDIVTCQQGLQFFVDRRAAFAQMQSALVQRGRLAATVWCRIERCGLFAALHRALAEREPDLAPLLCRPFDGPNADTLAREADASGFTEVVVTERERLLVLEGGIAQAARVLDATPVGAMIAELPRVRRDGLTRSITAHTAAFVQDDGSLRASMTALELVARKGA